MRTTLVKSTYLEFYKKKQPITLLKHFNKIKEKEFSVDHFGYYIAQSSVFSSMIEGNPIDFDSYLKYAEMGVNNRSKSFNEIEDLKKAYIYIKNEDLTLSNLLNAHAILTKRLLTNAKYRGKIRDLDVFIYGDGKKIYTGAGADIVKEETKTLFNDIEILLKRELSISETFYFASMIHLVFVKIHPFADGNGRSGRLLEKWFLIKKLGNKAFFIPSEKLYKTRLVSYYKNLDLGDNYKTINYDLSIPFLLMLPMALRLKA